MLIIVLFILDLVILALLIFHSYTYRGLRFTTGFFILGFLWIFDKRIIRILYTLPKKLSSPVADFIIPLLVTCVLLIILYIGWALAERIIKQVKYFKENLFAVLLLSILIITSALHCIEIILMHIGWYWMPGYTISGFLNNNSGFILKAWFFFNRLFLLAFPIFFLVECSKFRRVDWKSLLILLPFIREWFFLYLGRPGESFFIFEGILTFGILFILSLIYPLRIEYCYDGKLYKRLKLNSDITYLLDNIPFFMMLLILLIISIVDFFVLKQPLIIISTIPAIFFVLLYLKKIPIWVLTVLCLPFIILWEQKFILNISPVLFILILKYASFMKEKKT